MDPTKRWSSPLVFDSFQHRGETIRLVNQGLSDPARASSDALIAAVSILITIEVRAEHCMFSAPFCFGACSLEKLLCQDLKCLIDRWRWSILSVIPVMTLAIPLSVHRSHSSSVIQLVRLFLLCAPHWKAFRLELDSDICTQLLADRLWKSRSPEDTSGRAPADGRSQRELC